MLESIEIKDISINIKQLTLQWIYIYISDKTKIDAIICLDMGVHFE